MTNKEKLQAHNAELQELIGVAEALPDAGGGSDTEVDKYFAGDPAFLTLPTATIIRKEAFYNDDIGNENLVGISMPKVEEIKDNAFMDCYGLETIEMPSIKTIGNSSFFGFKKLNMTELPEGLLNIGPWAFYQCESLSITEIPSSVVFIDVNAFEGCTGLKTITFRGKPEVFPFVFSDCVNLTEIRVPWTEEENGDFPPDIWGADNATIIYGYKEE